MYRFPRFVESETRPTLAGAIVPTSFPTPPTPTSLHMRWGWENSEHTGRGEKRLIMNCHSDFSRYLVILSLVPRLMCHQAHRLNMRCHEEQTIYRISGPGCLKECFHGLCMTSFAVFLVTLCVASFSLIMPGKHSPAKLLSGEPEHCSEVF